LRVPWFDLAYYEYHHLLRAYRQLFGADAVLALPYEQFLTMPERMLENIAAFAGRPLDVGVAASLRPRHPKHGSHSAATTEVWRRVNRLVARSELHQAPLISSSWLEHVARRAIKRAARSPRLLGRPSRRLDERLYRQVAELVGDRYVESNRVTAELIGVDLAAYGWAL
jgi:hypothetical protein